MASPLLWRLGTIFGSKENTTFEALETRSRLFNPLGTITAGRVGACFMPLSLKIVPRADTCPIAKIRRIVQLLTHGSARPSAGSEAPTTNSRSSKIETERGNPDEVEMRTIDEIVAATLKTTEASLREAFEAGRAHTASALKNRMAAFFEGLISEAEGKIAVVAAPPHSELPHSPSRRRASRITPIPIRTVITARRATNGTAAVIRRSANGPWDGISLGH